MTERPLGIILAGGRATRMGGEDKALVLVRGTPLLGHCIARLGPQVAGLVINSNTESRDLARFGLPVIGDTLPGQLGPLAGILAGLDWAASQGAASIVTVAVDTPFFPPDLVDRLLRGRGPGGVAVAASRGPGHGSEVLMRRHPVFGLWPVTLRPTLRQALQGGLRKLALWADQSGAATVAFEAGIADPFFNINTPEDLRAAQDHPGAA